MAEDDESHTIEYKDMGLDGLVKALGTTIPSARIGVLGAKNRRSDSASNAVIAAAHEYGAPSRNLPQRSFLRIPIAEKLQSYLEKSGAFDEQVLKAVIAEKSIKIYVTKMAITALNVVLDAFSTGGFGKWRPSNMANKQNHQTLVETQQLRNSISYDVKETG